MDNLDLRDVVRPLLKWWWLLAASSLIAVVFSLYNTRNQPPEYRSTATLMVGTALLDPNPSGTEFSLGSQLAAAYADIAGRSTIYDATREALGLPSLPEYSVRQVPLTQIIEIMVEDVDPARAQAVAAELVNQLVLQTPRGQAESERQAFVEQQLNQMEVDINATKVEIERLNQELGTLFSARQIADTNTTILALETKLTVLQNNYASLLSSSQRGASNTISVLEPPNLPDRPIENNLVMYLLTAGLLGLVLAAAGAYLIEYLDDLLRTERDARRYLGLPTLGTIPSVNKRATSDDGLLLDADVFSPALDAFSGLRIALSVAAMDKPLRSLLITSPSSAENKSVVTANLCVELARAGHSVILVDADLHRPRQQRIFSVTNDIGLTTLLHDEGEHIGNMLQQTPQPGLAVLTSGPLHSNPAQLLGTKRMTILFDRLQDMADFVVVEAPPTVVAVDASILAMQVDGVLLVLTAGRTRRGVAVRAVKVLRQVGASLLGVVLNNVSMNQMMFSSSDGYRIAGVHMGRSYRAKSSTASGVGGFRKRKPMYHLAAGESEETTDTSPDGHS